MVVYTLFPLQTVVNCYAVAFLPRPPNVLRPHPFFQVENVCKTREKWHSHRGRHDSESLRAALVFSVSLVLFLLGNSLVFLSVFSLFHRDFEGLEG